jgi:adenylyltransferase/sulfurtransferase
MRMSGWGESGQEKLKASHVFVAGAGGLGSPVSIYLAVAGVGQITLCDFDSPDWSNLNRQILHNPSRIGINKAVSGKKTLDEMNSEIRINAYSEKIDENSVDRLVGSANVIVDCMDNFPTRFVLNDCAIRKGIPLVHGAIWGMEGRLTVISPPQTPCLRCLVQEAPPKEIFPVLGAVPGVIGSLEVIEVVKLILGIGESLKNRILIWDGFLQDFYYVKAVKDPKCPACSGLALRGR